MCGCRNSGGCTGPNCAMYPRNKFLKGSRNGSEQEVACTMTLDELSAIDSGKWTNAEKSLLQSQINIYHKNCTAYVERIKAIQEHYSAVP